MWGSYKLAADGRYYIVSGDVQGVLIGISNNSRAELTDVEILPCKVPRLDLGEHDVQGKTVLVSRKGGLGDVLMLTPLVRWLQEEAGATVRFGTAERNLAALADNPHVDRVISLPYTEDELDDVDYYIDFEGTIENAAGYPEARTMHGTDLFLQIAGLKPDAIPDEFKQPVFEFIGNGAVEWLAKLDANFEHAKGRERIVIHVNEHPIRGWHPARCHQLAEALGAMGYQVVLIGLGRARNQWWRMVETRYLNLVGHATLAEGIAAMSTADLFVCTDTGLCHFAGAMNVPTLAMFGPFPASVRTRYSPSVTVMEPVSDPGCGKWPCMQHDIGTLLPCGDRPMCMHAWGVDEMVVKVLGRLSLQRSIAQMQPALRDVMARAEVV